MMVFFNLAVVVAKVVYRIIPLLAKGSGSTWPGHVALMLHGRFVHVLLERNEHMRVILVAGTNGKTTTVKLGTHILEKQGKRVLTNREGANLLNGVASTFVRAMNIHGRVPYDIAFLEVDENSLPLVIKQIKNPMALVLLNVFRDQLDRYGEVNSIVNKWQESLKTLSSQTVVVINGDDPLLVSIGDSLSARVQYVGLPSRYMRKRQVGHDADIHHCPYCMQSLQYTKVTYAHLGLFHCPNCEFGKTHTVERFEDVEISIPLQGTYNLYNAYTIIFTIHHIYSISLQDITASLIDFAPAFGRQERVTYSGRQFYLMLVKNPAGFNQAIDAVVSDKGSVGTVMLLLNDRIPDGRDVSWIWDVDMEPLLTHVKTCIVSGDRTYDMGLRVAYDVGGRRPVRKEYAHIALEEDVHIIPELSDAIDYAIKHTVKNHTVYVFATYSAMLEIRAFLTGRKLPR